MEPKLNADRVHSAISPESSSTLVSGLVGVRFQTQVRLTNWRYFRIKWAVSVTVVHVLDVDTTCRCAPALAE